MRELSLPEKFLAEINREYPSLWREVDLLRAEKGAEWPPEVFLPFRYWLTNIGPYLFKGMRPNLKQIGELNRMATMTTWRPGQDIVRFDNDVYEAVFSTPLTGNFPVDVLWRLPAWAVYVESPGLKLMGSHWEGFITRLDISLNQEKQIRLCFLAADQEYGSAGRDIEYVLPLGDWSIEDALQKTLENTRIMMRESGMEISDLVEFEIVEGATIALNLVLYLCSYGFNYVPRQPMAKANYPVGARVKGGWRLFPPAKPRVHTLGEKVGGEIRKTEEAERAAPQGSHASPRPHIRRAHWHGYWTGPKKEDAKRMFNTRWLPPIPIALAGDADGHI